MRACLLLVPVLAAIALGACGDAGGSPLPRTEMIDCALNGAAGFAPDCSIERAQADGLSLLTIRHPDGGFRRFELGAGRGIVTADGFEQAEVIPAQGMVEVRVGADRYRLPFAE